MTDHLKEKRRSADAMIDVDQPEELWYWKRKLGCSAKRLREVIDEVGPLAHDVKTWLTGTSKL